MKTPEHYIAYPDRSWTSITEWENLPAGHTEKLGGATCIREKDFKEIAHRNDRFWNPATIGEKITLAPRHFIVWEKEDTGTVIRILSLESSKWDGWIVFRPKRLSGAACVIAQDAEQAENTAAEHRFWNPVDMEAQREILRQMNAPKAAHYPEAW